MDMHKEHIVYLDNNATTRVAPEVIEAMLPYFHDLWGNPSSMHDFGGQVGPSIDAARQHIATIIGAQHETEIIFTSCGTESDSTAILSALKAYPDRKHIITTRVEHPAVLSLTQALNREGYQITWLSVDKHGMLDLNELAAAITDNTAVVSVMTANNETGVIFPIEQIGQIVKQRGVLFHTDAVQAVHKVPLDVSKIESIDMLSLSGHKLHAPKGIGALYVRRGTKFRPFLIGGHQERNRRAGTENVPYIVGLGRAAELGMAHMHEDIPRIKAMRDRLERSLLEKIPYSRLNGHPELRLVNTSNISFEFVEGEAILLMISQLGIAASSGSACTSGTLEPSHVLRAMGVPFNYAHGSVRFSLSRYNTNADIDYTIDHFPGIIEKLRSISPFSPDKAPTAPA